jgi:hypothetical protein
MLQVPTLEQISVGMLAQQSAKRQIYFIAKYRYSIGREMRSVLQMPVCSSAIQ